MLQKITFLSLLVCLCVSPLVSRAQSQSPVDLQADALSHDDGGQIVTASGDVVLEQDGRVVKANQIVYNLAADTVVATGNVEFIEINGDKHYGERFEFNNALKDGFVEGLKTFLIDGSRFKASNGRHESGTKTVMKDAFYTPCEACKVDPDAAPLWQIRASEVEHDKEKKRITYRNARFEIKGVPIAYVPYFAHADGSVERKSGFLSPAAGYSSDLGAFVESSYYWSIAPDKDLTAGVRVMSDEAPLGFVEWRQRWQNASLVAEGSVTRSSRRDRSGGNEIVRDDDVRGHVSVDALWNINNKWRAGADINYTSDNQYFRQYDFNSEDILESEIFLERFSGRNYGVARLLKFQDLRVGEDFDDDEDEPNILPEVELSFIGEPGGVPLIGGRWSLDTSFLGLTRSDEGQDVNRAYAALGWKRRLVSDYGLVSVLDAHGEGAYYDVNDRVGSLGSNVIQGNSDEGRAFAYFNAKTSYPISKQYKTSQLVVEPIVSATFSPNISLDDNIPNEDSQDVQLDALNVFEPDRFPGIDGVEDQSHMTYGLRTGLYGDGGSYGEAFIGQSYRFQDDDNPFAPGSGLDDRSSDVVGQLTASYGGDYTLDYRFQLDSENISSQRHEADATLTFSNLTLSSQYLYAKALGGTDIDERREQINNSASYDIDENWRVYGGMRHDLGDDPGLRNANVGLDYLGQCISWSVIGQRTLTDDSSGDNGTEIFFRIGLKNLGEFQTSGFQLGNSSE